MRLFLRYMSDHRFKEILQAELDLIGKTVEIKELEDDELLLSADVKYTVLSNALKTYFEEVPNTARSLLFSKLKSTISKSLREHTNGPPYIKYAGFLKDELHHSYQYLSTLFSQFSGSTLEKYILSQRIELVKHMLVKGKLPGNRIL